MKTEMDFARREFAFACEQGNLERVRQLLDWGVEPDQPLEGRSFLNRAALRGQHVVTKILLRAGVVPSRDDFVAAVQGGSRHAATRIYDALLDREIEPMAYSWSSRFAERGFVEQLTPDLAAWLVANGLDLSETDVYGRSLVDLAAPNATPEVLAALRGE